MKISINVGDASWMIGWCSGVASNFVELWSEEGPHYRKEVSIEVLRFRRLGPDTDNMVEVTAVVVIGALARKKEIAMECRAEKFSRWEADYPSTLLRSQAAVFLQEMREVSVGWFSDVRTVSEKVLSELQKQ